VIRSHSSTPISPPASFIIPSAVQPLSAGSRHSHRPDPLFKKLEAFLYRSRRPRASLRFLLQFGQRRFKRFFHSLFHPFLRLSQQIGHNGPPQTKKGPESRRQAFSAVFALVRSWLSHESAGLSRRQCRSQLPRPVHGDLPVGHQFASFLLKRMSCTFFTFNHGRIAVTVMSRYLLAPRTWNRTEQSAGARPGRVSIAAVQLSRRFLTAGRTGVRYGDNLFPHGLRQPRP